MTNELQNIISGTKQVKHGTFIQTIANYLSRSQETSLVASNHKHIKNEEEKRLIDYIENNNLWINDIDINCYLSEGAEQKVYLKDDFHVWKLNDSIYYESWQDYFINLLLNNHFFSDTAYQLKGFYSNENVIYAVVIQNFVKANQKTNLSKVKEFMLNNGFENTRNNDYYNLELGIILEDLHDENVLTQDGILYFIDTVFYIKK